MARKVTARGPSGRIALEPAMALLREAQGYFRSIAPAGVLWSDELIAERRKEARREVERLNRRATYRTARP